MMAMDRRNMMGGMGAMLVAAKAPAAAPPALVKPPRLRPGDMVGLIEPAGFTDDAFDLALVMETIRAMGLVPKPAAHLAQRHGYLAGRDADRAADVNAMFADRQVKGVFAVRGGWGCARILPFLDFATIRANPKLLVGFFGHYRAASGFCGEGGLHHHPWTQCGERLGQIFMGRLPRGRLRRRDSYLHQSCGSGGPAGPARGPHPHIG